MREKSILITDSELGLSEEQRKRSRNYFIAMMIRTFCFILTVVLPSPFRWVALIFAVTLPYFAVVIANAGRETIVKFPNFENRKQIKDKE
jgi:predicted tellurium resistance membrane protein TerC